MIDYYFWIMLIIPCDTILSSKAHKMVSAGNLLQGEGFHNIDLKSDNHVSWNTLTPLGNPAYLRVLISLNKLHFILFNLYYDIGLFKP